MNEFNEENIERVSLVDVEEDAEDNKSGKKGLIIGIIVVSLLGCGFAAWKLGFLPFVDNILGMSGTGTEEIADSLKNDNEINGRLESEEIEDEEPVEPPPFGEVYVISDLVINPAGQRRLFMVSIGLEYFETSSLEKIQKREILLRDNLITLFGSQPIDVLNDIRYRQAFRNRIKKIMDYQLGKDTVTRIFFEKWVFQ